MLTHGRRGANVAALLFVVLLFEEYSEAFGDGGVKARLCVVGRPDSSGSAAKYCPLMDVQESPAICVVAFDRLECLRRLKEGKADFAVLEAEDLLVASKSTNPQILVTNELRIWRKRNYEHQMLVIVRNTLNITGVADLRGKKFCHPGHALPFHWPEVSSKFFESQVVPQACENNISLVENFIKSSSEYFGSACKPGPWVDDEDLDAKLKSKYSTLCQLCDLPKQCGMLDKYWGPEGSLTCLSDEVGDVTWARMSDVLFHFGIDPDVPALAVPAEFSVLCPNGTLQSLAPLTRNSPPPCSWMSRPWGVIAARAKIAEDIKKMVMSINRTSSNSWQWALHYMLTTNDHEIIPSEIITPEDYLAKADGFLAASTPTSCGSNRGVKWCVESLEEEAKCSWWREAALANGLEPPLVCVSPDGEGGCIGGLAQGVDAGELTVVHAQNEALARRMGLKPLVYEYSSKLSDYFVASLIVKANSKIEKLSDLRGKRACFMNHMGIGWNSLLSALKREGLLPPICPYEKAISSFFRESCVPGLNTTITTQEEYAPNLESLCRHTNKLKGRPPKHLSGKRCCEENADGYVDAFHCLVSGDGDVAIVDMGMVHKPTECKRVTPDAKKPSSTSPKEGTPAEIEWFSPFNTLKEGFGPDVKNGTQWDYKPGPEMKCQGHNKEPWTKYIPTNNIRILCTKEDGSKACHIGWSPKGLVMSSANVTASRLEEVYMLLLQMDYAFGKRRKMTFSHLPMPIPHFTLYGPHDGRSNVIFQDSTHYLVKLDTLKKESPLKHNYEDVLNNVIVCSSVAWATPVLLVLSISSLLLYCL